MKLDLEGRRLVIAHNPHSSRSRAVQQSVFDRLDSAGLVYELIEVRQASLADNVARLKSQIHDGDIILSAAGDGSAHAVAHSVIAAAKKGVELGFLAYGNFNDLPHAFNSSATLRDPVAFLEAARSEKVYALDILVDDKLLRHALLYATFGWTAQAAAIFGDPKLRGKLTQGGAGLGKSLSRLGVYYFQSRRSSLLPNFSLNGITHNAATDLILANGPAVARVFRTGSRYYRKSKEFRYTVLDVRKLFRNAPFLLGGLVGRMPTDETSEIKLDFGAPADLPIQCDGEVVKLRGVRSIVVRKDPKPLNILTTKN
ncbi:MAG: diacylglycerol kinase family protein [Candidatus Saccharimonas sp.]